MNETEFIFRLDPVITESDGLATIEDIYDLHNNEEDGYTGEGVTVAVMDSGVDRSHPVFENTQVEQVDFTGEGQGDDIGHGTGVAGLIAMIAPDVEIRMLRVFGKSGRTSFSTLSDAYSYVIERSDDFDLLNMSLGAQEKHQVFDDLHNRMIESGVRDVVAAGNTGGKGGSPATAKLAFSAGALTEDGEPTRFSSYNPDWDNPDVSAIGKNVKLARADGTSMGRVIDENWVKASGTSFAAPITAGFSARYIERGNRDTKSRFEETARDIPNVDKDGDGILDYGKATRDEPDEPEEPDYPNTSASVFDLGNNDLVFLREDWLSSGKYEAKLVEDEDGRSVVEFNPD